MGSETIVQMLIKPIQELNEKKVNILQTAENYEAEGKTIDALVFYSQALDIFAKLGDIDNLISLYKKIYGLLDSFSNIRNIIKANYQSLLSKSLI